MDRRTFLTTAAVASLPVAAAAETPDERVDRLAWELADALSEYSDGNFYAVIHPSIHDRFPVEFMKRSVMTRV